MCIRDRHYSYHQPSTRDSKDIVAKQVFSNFNRHFKVTAEDYELFDLKTKAGIPRKLRRNSSKITKDTRTKHINRA